MQAELKELRGAPVVAPPSTPARPPLPPAPATSQLGALRWNHGKVAAERPLTRAHPLHYHVPPCPAMSTGAHGRAPAPSFAPVTFLPAVQRT